MTGSDERDQLPDPPGPVADSAIMIRFPKGPDTTEATISHSGITLGQLQIAAAEIDGLARDSRMAQRMAEAQRRAAMGLQLPGVPGPNGVPHG